MEFGFKQPLVGEKRCVTTLITAAEETIKETIQMSNFMSSYLRPTLFTAAEFHNVDRILLNQLSTLC